MHVKIPYGKQKLDLDLPAERFHVEMISPQAPPDPGDPGALTVAALDAPEGGAALANLAGINSVAVAITDKTRPLPLAPLRALLQRIERDLKLPPQAITLLIGVGTHAPMPADEFPDLLPADLLARYPVFSHDCDDADQLVYKGETSRGTPVWSNRRYDAADLRVVIGNLNPHQFMGYSGGVKGAAIGLAGRATITANHQMMTHPDARLGEYTHNPVRQDVEEIGHLMGIHFALSLLLDNEKRVQRALAGDPLAVMAAGVPLADALFAVPVAAPFDLVITSPGGHPKDINLYQAQKALAHAAMITRAGGHVILTAACPEGSGSAKYERWMQGVTSHTAALERFAAQEFTLGHHKAFQIARDAVRVHLRLVTQMPRALTDYLLLEAYPDLASALGPVLAELPAGARISVMTAANATVPRLSTHTDQKTQAVQPGS